jgi:uncharacterized ferredoxin-like protein
MIINELDIKEKLVNEIAGYMMLAARTAPKAKGQDNLIIKLINGKELDQLADYMDESVQRHGRQFFHRDALNIRQAQVVVVIGTRIRTMGLDCGYCGFPTCAEKEKQAAIPCAFSIHDLGLAIGSAVSLAADARVDTRVMFSAGMAAMEMGWLGEDCRAAFAIPISATSKNPFFDRPSSRPSSENR